MPRLFWDSYAFLEFRKGHPAMARYDREFRMVTSRYQLVEVHYALLRTEGAAADEAFDAFLPHCVEPSDEVLKSAMRFRLRLRRQRRRLSYADAIGYTQARALGVRFLTGDPDLRGLPNVEFVR